MIVLKILLIIACVLAALFLLTLVIYFFNLDMKGAAMVMPLLEKLYDRRERKNSQKESKAENRERK